MERNFFEKLVRENFRFGRMCRNCESTEMNRESAHRTWNRKSAQQPKGMCECVAACRQEYKQLEKSSRRPSGLPKTLQQIIETRRKNNG